MNCQTDPGKLEALLVPSRGPISHVACVLKDLFELALALLLAALAACFAPMQLEVHLNNNLESEKRAIQTVDNWT